MLSVKENDLQNRRFAFLTVVLSFEMALNAEKLPSKTRIISFLTVA